MADGDLPGRYLEDVLLQLRKLKGLADRAVAQVGDEAFAASLDAEGNSIALVLKHLGGNMRSRWRDFLHSDGEEDRDRDAEFVLGPGDGRESILAGWEAGWSAVFAAIEPLAPADLGRTVTIRGEPHTVLQAIDRQLTHYAYHVGQVVLLARHFAGPRWLSLSIPRGKSKEFEVAKDGSRYLVRDPEGEGGG